MTNTYDYENEFLNNNETIENYIDLEEGFSYISNDNLCKTIIFGMLFYIINNNVMRFYLKKINLFIIDVEILQVCIFMIFYYIISLYL